MQAARAEWGFPGRQHRRKGDSGVCVKHGAAGPGQGSHTGEARSEATAHPWDTERRFPFPARAVSSQG